MKKGWEKKRLREVTTKIGSGATPLGGEAAYKAAGTSLIRSLNVYDDGFRTTDLAFIDDNQAAKLENVVVEAGDVLLNITGASVARCCIAPNEFLPARVNQHVSIIRPSKESLLPEFLHYLLISRDYKNRLLAVGEDGGSTRQAITKAQLLEFEIEFPPLAEQQRIVGLLDEAFAELATAQAHAEKNLQNARALFESHLQTVFTQRGKGWVEKRFEDVVTEDCTLSYGIVQPGDETDGGLPVVRPTDLTRDIIILEGLKRIEPQRAASYQRTTLQGGELLMCVRGTTGVVSKAATELVGANVTRGIVPIRLRSDLIAGDFGFHLLRSEPVQAQIKAKTYGAALMQINIGDLRQITLVFPPLSEQKTIAAQLDALSAETQRLAAIYTRKQAALAALKQSLLHQAFAGEL